MKRSTRLWLFWKCSPGQQNKKSIHITTRLITMHSIDCLDCLQPLNLRTWKKKRAQTTQGWGAGFASEASKKKKFLGPHTLPRQVFRFALVSSSLAIPSAHSTIEWKYEKIQSNLYKRPCIKRSPSIKRSVVKAPKIASLNYCNFDLY